MENTNQNTTPQNNQISQKTIMGILAYLGILVIIPFLMEKNDPTVKFHVKQGFVLLAIEVLVWILGMMFWPLWMLLNIINLAVLILSIIGIVNVVQNKQKELPFVGSYAKYFNF